MTRARLCHGLACALAFCLLGGELGLIALFFLAPYLPAPAH